MSLKFKKLQLQLLTLKAFEGMTILLKKMFSVFFMHLVLIYLTDIAWFIWQIYMNIGAAFKTIVVKTT